MALRRAWEHTAQGDSRPPWPSLDTRLAPLDDPEAADRVADGLRREVVRALLDEARAAGARGREGRARLRLVGVPFFDRAAREPDLEAFERWRRQAPAGAGFEQLVAQPAPVTRRATAGAAWRRAVDELSECLERRWTLASSAADCVGAAGVDDLLSFLEDEDEGAGEQDLSTSIAERGWLAPRDEGVAREADARRSRAESRLGPLDDDLADVVLERLADHASAGTDPFWWRGIVIELARAIGFPCGTRGPEVAPEIAAGRETELYELAGGRPRIVIGGAPAGPGAGWAALAALGRGMRASWIRARHGDAALVSCDPAGATAAQVLFARLLTGERFAVWSRVAQREAWTNDLRFELAIEPRRWWARARVRGPSAGSDIVPAWTRATGRQPPPSARILAARWDVDPRDLLRGASYAVLIEERLRSRWGHAWFADRSAGRWLGELWDAEPSEGPARTVRLWSLGRMDSATLLEGFRP